MSQHFSGKVALITGGAAGIGRATALAFADEGIHLAIADIDPVAGEATCRDLREKNVQALFLRCDVTQETEVAALLAAAVKTFGRVDYAFNNAGIEIEQTRLAEGSAAVFDAIMGVNVKGVWLCMKHELLQMQSQGSGVIVNTASVAGLLAAPKMSIYSASKHAVIGLTKSAAVEYARKGIRVNAVCPAIIETDMYRRAAALDPKKAEFAARLHPVGRLGQAEEIAAAVLYLCSDGASFTTGHSLVVDGGATVI